MANLYQIAVVDLFCGVGGLAHGFFLEGLNVVAGIDNDKTCEFAFTENNKARFICKDVKELRPNEIRDLYPKNSIKILVGCAPCQPFADLQQHIGNAVSVELGRAIAKSIKNIYKSILLFS
ncbi:MAG: DNA (cytosine-5-)-methyltransferase [bacterium]|nr:MAG: DNA (cytosine-5-)-methyltransferase [bacterium]